VKFPRAFQRKEQICCFLYPHLTATIAVPARVPSDAIQPAASAQSKATSMVMNSEKTPAVYRLNSQ